MKPILIDFAAPGLRRTLFHVPRRAWVLLGAALALWAAAASAGWHHYKKIAAYEAQQAQQARARARASAPAARTVALHAQPLAPAQAAAVNAAIMQLNLPWRALHDAVRAATPPSVALLALEPDAKKHTLRITAETRASDGMIDYVRSLREQEGFASVTLARHEIVELDPNHPVRFQVDAQWRGQ
jgi:Tfp pilus assembly protein PilN